MAAASPEDADANMADISASTGQTKSHKSRDLFTCTISKPLSAYAQLELVSTDHQRPAAGLDNLQVRSYCTAALTQFLGATGAGMPVDILKVQGSQCWVRVPREDLGAFTAAITLWRGPGEGGSSTLLQVRASGNWLGGLLGRSEQQTLWNS